MIRFDNVTKKFGNGIVAVEEINLEIPDHEFIFICGASGAGKTTLLRLLTRDILPTAGIVFLNDWNLVKLPARKIPHLRRRVGTVFQDFKLLADQTVFENVALSLEILGEKEKVIKEKVNEVLKALNLVSHASLFPIQLSGGELQRVVLARAVVGKPEILLADEPTGNLDPATSWEIIKILQKINEAGTTVIMATHNVDIVDSLGKRVVKIDKGTIKKDEKKGKYSS